MTGWTLPRDAPAGRPDHDQTPRAAEGVPVDAARLLRFGVSLQAMVEELRAAPGRMPVDRFAALVQARLDEADSFLSPGLADEVHRLVSPLLAGGETERDLRVILAQLDGWVAGLVQQVAIVVPQPES